MGVYSVTELGKMVSELCDNIYKHVMHTLDNPKSQKITATYGIPDNCEKGGGSGPPYVYYYAHQLRNNKMQSAMEMSKGRHNGQVSGSDQNSDVTLKT